MESLTCLSSGTQGVRAVGSLGCQGGARGLEFLQRHAQIARHSTASLCKEQTQHVGRTGLRRVHGPLRRRGYRGGPRPGPTVSRIRNASRSETRLTLNCSTSTSWRGREIPVGEVAVDDLAAQLVGYDFSDPRGRKPAPRIGTNSQGGHPILAGNSRRRVRNGGRAHVLIWLSYLSSNGINSVY